MIGNFSTPVCDMHKKAWVTNQPEAITSYESLYVPVSEQDMAEAITSIRNTLTRKEAL